MTLAPIALFVYNRPFHTLQTLESLKKNDLADQSDLYIFCDGPKKDCSPETLEQIRLVRKIAKEQQWCKNVYVHESEKNNTHPVNLVQRVTELVNKFGRIIVLEDDLVLGKGFLKYMNDALEFYKDEEKVMYISGYLPPILKKNLPETFFVSNLSNWGWATWKRSWSRFMPEAKDILAKVNTPELARRFSMDGSNNYYELLKKCAEGPWKYWDIRWYGSVFVQGGLILHPKKSLVRNIGHDKSGMHCDDDFILRHQAITDYVNVERIPLKENTEVRKAIKNLYLFLYDYSFFSVNNAKGILKKVIPSFIYNYLKNKKNFLLTSGSANYDVVANWDYKSAPFNDDTYLEKEFLQLKNKHQIQNVVEIGTHKGITTRWLATNFQHVFSIENSTTDYPEALSNVSGMDHVTLLKGENGKTLTGILDKVTGSTIVFINAGGKEEKLLPDLHAIEASNLKPILSIYGIKNPQDPTMGYSMHNGHGTVLEFSSIKERLDKIYGKNQYHYYYNKQAEGARKGVLFCLPLDETKAS